MSSIAKTGVRTYQNFINGQWVSGASGETFPVYDPSTEEVIAQVASSNAADIDKAVKAARAKVDLYAEAAGVRIGGLLHIEDVDPEQPGTSRYRSHAEAAATTAQDLAPGHIVVSAAVILGYAVGRD